MRRLLAGIIRAINKGKRLIQVMARKSRYGRRKGFYFRSYSIGPYSRRRSMLNRFLQTTC